MLRVIGTRIWLSWIQSLQTEASLNSLSLYTFLSHWIDQNILYMLPVPKANLVPLWILKYKTYSVSCSSAWNQKLGVKVNFCLKKTKNEKLWSFMKNIFIKIKCVKCVTWGSHNFFLWLVQRDRIANSRFHLKAQYLLLCEVDEINPVEILKCMW